MKPQYLQDQLARWLEELSQYDMVIQHNLGGRRINADALSRPPPPSKCRGVDFTVNLSDLPCGGCPKCTRAHQSWIAFADEVDDVAPLARPGSWTYSPVSGEESSITEDHSPITGDREEATPSISEAALGYVSKKLLGRISEVDGEGQSSPDGPYQSQIQISHYPQFACVMGISPGGLGGPPSLVGLTPEEMSRSQLSDVELRLILDWLQRDVEPEEGKLFLASPAVKHYYIIRNLLRLDNDRVLWKEMEEGGERKVLVVPIEPRREVLRLCHDVPTAGHQGIERTRPG